MATALSLGNLVTLAEAAVSAGDKAINAINSAASGSNPSLNEAFVGVTAAASALLDLTVPGLIAGSLDLYNNLVKLEAKVRSGANARDIAASIVELLEQPPVSPRISCLHPTDILQQECQ